MSTAKLREGVMGRKRDLNLPPGTEPVGFIVRHRVRVTDKRDATKQHYEYRTVSPRTYHAKAAADEFAELYRKANKLDASDCWVTGKL